MVKRVSLGKLIKDRDMFGEPIGIHYKGQSQFGTLTGGVLSLVAWLLILMYGCFKGVKLVGRRDPDKSLNTLFHNFADDVKSQSLEDLNFDVAIMFYDTKKQRNVLLDPQYFDVFYNVLTAFNDNSDYPFSVSPATPIRSCDFKTDFVKGLKMDDYPVENWYCTDRSKMVL